MICKTIFSEVHLPGEVVVESLQYFSPTGFFVMTTELIFVQNFLLQSSMLLRDFFDECEPDFSLSFFSSSSDILEESLERPVSCDSGVY